MLNLCKGTRPDERFHLQNGPPVPHVMRPWWGIGFVRVVRWSNLWLPDRQPGNFSSWWLFGNVIHWYRGTVKCDGTRTGMYWRGQLDNGIAPVYVPDPNQYVMATTEKEKFAVRFFIKPGDPVWSNMGGS